ncbi:hypothetical protein C8Q77DRAFT_472019 [Trametes polyzona]|nr:hypothetical protein C8Q77DRAFT_472019 [Trametes polyzona]
MSSRDAVVYLMEHIRNSVIDSAPYPTTMGAVALGVVLGLMLYGVTVYQMYAYFRVYNKDKRILKGFVVVVFVLETIHTFLMDTGPLGWRSCQLYVHFPCLVAVSSELIGYVHRLRPSA